MRGGAARFVRDRRMRRHVACHDSREEIDEISDGAVATAIRDRTTTPRAVRVRLGTRTTRGFRMGAIGRRIDRVAGRDIRHGDAHAERELGVPAAALAE